tara:strand:- start:1405 stop:3243 length:1839 start_codon:yes stop_codon:yes gene_type:complete
MNDFTIFNIDQFLRFLRNADTSVNYNISNLSINEYTINMPFDFNSDLHTLIDSIDGISYEDFEFSYNTNNKVEITQVVNYNAQEYFREWSSVNASGLPHIYENPEAYTKELFLNKPNQIGGSTSGWKPGALASSLTPNPYTAAKYEFPYYVNIAFKNSEVEPLAGVEALMGHSDSIEAIMESLHLQEIPINTFVTSEGDMEIENITYNNVISGVPENTNDWKLEFITETPEDQPNTQYDMIQRIAIDNAIESIKLWRGYTSLISNEKACKTELFCYKIEKFIEGEVGPIKTVYIPSTRSYANYIDTQVMYGSTYTYKIYEIFFAYGTNYQYQTMTLSTPARIAIYAKSDTRLFKRQIGEKAITISSYAPLTPEVSFLNDSSHEREIRFYFEPSTHEMRQPFVGLLDSDLQTTSNMMYDNDSNVIFKLSEGVINYQIFKLNEKPKRLMDFANGFYDETANITPANSEVYQIKLTPNRKYYFLFRSKNDFGLFSNPTAVFEIELIQDSDSTTIASKAIQLEEANTQRSKTFGRFLKIYPAFEQLMVTEMAEKSGIEMKLSNNSKVIDGKMLGIRETRIWGRKFKIRIKSNNSGKLIDFNVDFKFTKKLTEEDFT